MKLKRICVSCALVLLGCQSHGPNGGIAMNAPNDAATETPSDAGPKVKDAGKDSGMDAGKDAGPDAAVIDPAAPLIEFTQPSAAVDPNNDVVLTKSSIAVHCKVTRSTNSAAADVNKSAVVITLDQFADPSKKIMPPINALANDEYEAIFDVSMFPNGPLHFSCQAKDLATTPHAGSTPLSALLDLGPNIVFTEPKDKGIYTLKTPVVIQFDVTSQKLTETDVESAVKDVMLNVGGMMIPVTESKTTPGSYQTTVDFDDHTLFLVPPVAAEIRVIATDQRTPEAAIRNSRIDIGIDGDGPAISVDAPKNATIVHGDVVLKISVSDSSGVKPGSLVASINDDTLVIKTWDLVGSSFQQRFDTRVFPPDKVTQLTINVTATDTVGNQSTVSHLLRLDNLPPTVSLDPPDVRMAKMPSATSYICSEAFDPVGSWAAGDLQKVRQSSLYRAMVEDKTNHSPGANFAYHAGVASGTVVLYAQSRADTPLLIDTNDDGVCDEINDPADKRPVQVKLTALDPRGTPWYDSSISLREAQHDVGANPFCTTDVVTNTVPPPLCPNCEMRVALDSALEGRQPAIWALTPTNNNLGECEGTTWELASALHDYEGWVCLAVRAEDNIGNIGISAPIRVCIDDEVGSAPDCGADKAPPCVGVPGGTTCKIEPAQRFAPNMVYLPQ